MIEKLSQSNNGPVLFPWKKLSNCARYLILIEKTKIENHPTHIALGSFLWTNFRWSEAKIEKLDVSRKDNIFDILAMNDSGNERKKQFSVYGGDVVGIQDIHKTGCYSKIGGHRDIWQELNFGHKHLSELGSSQDIHLGKVFLLPVFFWLSWKKTLVLKLNTFQKRLRWRFPAVKEWSTLIGRDPSRNCALIGWDLGVTTSAVLCHKDIAQPPSGYFLPSPVCTEVFTVYTFKGFLAHL